MSNDAIDYINRDIVNVKNELHVLSKLVRDGNGQPSLLSQVATLSNRLENVELNVQAGFEDLKNTFEESQKAALEKNKLSWHFKTAVVVALITSLTSILINYSQTSQAATNTESAAVARDDINKKLDTIIRSQAKDSR